MKYVLTVIATLMASFIIFTVWMPKKTTVINRCDADYQLNVSSEGEGFILFTDDKTIATWQWGEYPKLDSLILNDNE